MAVVCVHKKKESTNPERTPRTVPLGGWGWMRAWPTDELAVDALVPQVVEFLETCAARAAAPPELPGFSRFEAFRAEISVRDFVRRCVRYLDTDWFSLRFALHYLQDFDALYCVTRANAHLLFASALLVSTKFWHDFTYDLQFYSKVFGTEVRQLFELECAFWTALQSRLWSPDVQQLARSLEARLELPGSAKPSAPDAGVSAEVRVPLVE